MDATRTRMLFPRESTGSSREGGSNSASGILSTLAPTFIIAAVAFSIFLLVRNRYSRVYRPRSDERILPEEKRTPRSGQGFFGIIRNFASLPDHHVLQHSSMDNYLFLRYFKMLIVMSFIGCCITWPVLFPVNATGGGGAQQLDMLSMSNIDDVARYYAHACVAIVYFTVVVLLIARERLFFVGLRRAYFLSAGHAQRLSSRVVMVMGLPADHMNEASLRETFGSSVRKIWFPTDCKQLEKDVKKRNKTALKLENGEMKLIKQSNVARTKALKKNPNMEVPAEAGPAHWINEKKRPRHRLLPNIFKKVDTINWSRGTLIELNRHVTEQQNNHLDLKTTKYPAAFIEFSTQSAAHNAFQTVNVGLKQKTKFNPRYIGVQPEEVVWENLGTTYSSRKLKMAIATAIICVMIIFWAIPVAFVGILSNIDSLTEKVTFLSFIKKIPGPILGVVTGLLPVVLLAVLMMLVPIFCRILAKQAGEPTLSAIELKCQSWYFAFQVVQVFLITTFTSSASAVASKIVSNPSLAPSLLAENLPKASNFYISYFILFGLMQGALQLLNIVPLLMFTFLGGILDGTPRKKFNRFIQLAGLGWGSTYPKFTNMGVIFLSYACIAPLLLGFSTIGFGLLYLGFRYNFLFVLGNNVDMKGEAYAKAMKQLMTGIYIAIFCLIGLFGIGISKSSVATGCVALMLVFLVVVIVFQFLFDRAIAPLERHLPLDMLKTNKFSNQLTDQTVDEHELKQEQLESGVQHHGRDSASSEATATKTETQPGSAPPKGKKSPFDFLTVRLETFVTTQYEKARRFTEAADHESWMPNYTSEEYEQAYLNPAITDPLPIIWLAKDHVGLSGLMVSENKAADIQSTDAHAEFNEKNKVVWQEEQVREAPIWQRPVYY